MKRLLFLCHRIPYPPEKGDKIRAWHMLRHLAQSWQVDLGCLVDDPQDLQHIPVLEECCSVVRALPTGSSLRAAARALLRCRPGEPLTPGWFHNVELASWVRRGLAEGRYDAVFAYSAAMAPYLIGQPGFSPGVSRVLDLVDVDSEKWRAYAAKTRTPMRYVWRREAQTLLGYERRAAMAFDRCLFVSQHESARFAELAPETIPHLDWVENGVDMSFFDPERPYPSPYGDVASPLVFTGTMNYRPNVEAVCWFARNVLPKLRETFNPSPEFFIVGANPAPAVRSLATIPGVHVIGAVNDIRPYIAHAAVSVAPLGIARGIQNKVLEAMALARPVVASSSAFEGVHAQPGRDLLVGDGVAQTVNLVSAVLRGEHPGLGAAARRAMLAGHDWSATLRRLDTMLSPAEHRMPELGAVA
jgi:sugar transferase (PEP-CTERM/EpsH1 system associated)